jgi:hypothetical protein
MFMAMRAIKVAAQGASDAAAPSEERDVSDGGVTTSEE